MPARLRRSLLALVASIAPLALTLAACSSDDNEAPSGPLVFDPLPPTSGNAGTGGTGAGGTTGGTGGASSGTGGAASGSGGTGGVAPGCLDPSGCFSASCTPQSTEQFLNRCTDSTCAPFDNAARLPLFNGGNLPSLP